jgi:hypothetical protein
MEVNVKELVDWLMGTFSRGPRSGLQRVKTMPAPKAGMSPCWVWQGATSHSGKGGSTRFPKGKVAGCEQTVHVQGEVLRRKYGWPDLKGNVKVKINCGNSLCCNPDHLQAGELTLKVA